MIPKSIMYKLARKSDNFIIAEGNKKEISALHKNAPNTKIWLGSPASQLGQVICGVVNSYTTKDFTVRRLAGMYSTAEGYDIHVSRAGAMGTQRVRVYRANVHDMNRFYRVSKGNQSIRLDKAVDWLTFQKQGG